MAVQNDANPAGPVHRALTALYEVKISTVFYLVSASLGLGLAGAQIDTTWVVVLFAVVWGVTVIAMLVLAARLLNEHLSQGRRRQLPHG